MPNSQEKREERLLKGEQHRKEAAGSFTWRALQRGGRENKLDTGEDRTSQRTRESQIRIQSNSVRGQETPA
jgi:hypothetical protein